MNARALVLLFLSCALACPCHKEEHLNSFPNTQLVFDFDLEQVRLTGDNFITNAQKLNGEYLHLLTPDRLLYTFRANANLSTEGAEPMGGWESPSSLIRGHFVAMYLDASAKHYRSTGDQKQLATANYMVSVMKECQEAIGTGYLSAFPSYYFDLLENLNFTEVWSTYYMIHKIMVGLYEMHLLGNEDALPMIEGMISYHLQRIRRVIQEHSIYRWELILTVEFGGMNEFMYLLYGVTNNPDHLEFAQYFDQYSLMGPLAIGKDSLTTLHANTHIPQVLGAAARYNVLEDPVARNITSNFWDLIVEQRSYATGGSNGGTGAVDATIEHWGDPSRLQATLSTNNQEFCTQYNIMMVSRNMYLWSMSLQFADHYERAIYNGIMGNQFPNTPGVMLYYTPLGNGVSKSYGNWATWGTPWDSFWCCYASAIIQWAKIGDSIYFRSPDNSSLFVNLFISSNLTISSDVVLSQATNYPIESSTQLQFNILDGSYIDIALNIRVPFWATNGGQLTVNGVEQPVLFTASTYLVLEQLWENDDIIEVNFNMTFHLDPIIDNPNLVAVMYGPLVLVGLTNSTGPLNIDPTNISDCFTSTSDDSVRFESNAGCFGDLDEQVEFIPLYETVDEFYGVYFYVNDVSAQ